MKRKTISRNPLDQLGPAAPSRRKNGRRRPAVPAHPELQSQIREAVLHKKPADKRGALARWFDAVLDHLTG